MVLGPSTFNFADAAAEAIRVGAARQVQANGVVTEALRLIADPAQRHAMQQAALRFASEHRGATQRTLDALAPWLSAALAASPNAPREAQRLGR